LAIENPDRGLGSVSNYQIRNYTITQFSMTLLLDRVESVRRKRETGLPSFGQKLKQEREKRNITLEQISASTKIGIRMLQALEEDNFSELPGGIFNRGFVRAYSRFLGLDEDQTIADYMQASGDALPVPTETAARTDGSRENAAHEGASRENKNKDDKDKVSRLGADTPPRQVPWGVFAGALLVVALALSFWSHRRREHTRQAARPTPATVATQVSGQVSGSDLPTASSPTNGSPTGVPAPSVVPKTSHDLAPASPAAIPGEFTVVIQAREESWTTITADGKTISSELLPADTERVVRARKEIVVRTGNSGGVDFRFNDKKVDTGGDYGEVKTVTFGPRGVLPNAPSPPSTP
jgi:cytoskeleton protein RodZ